jgi:hypothetical protein
MIQTMNPRERVLAALAHKEPDRTPRDLGGTAVSGMNVVAYRNLIYYLALDLPVEIRCQRIRHARKVEEVLELFGVDTRPVFPPGCFEVGNPDESGICTDGFGIRRELSSEAGNLILSMHRHGVCSCQVGCCGAGHRLARSGLTD